MTAPAPMPGAAPSDPLALAKRVQEAGDKVGALAPEARAAAIELREAVEAVHAAGLRALVRILLADEHSAGLLREAAREPATRTILLLHGILRPDIATQATEILARLRPALAQIGGDVEVDHVEGGTLFVRLTGACAGNSMTALSYQEQVCQVLAEQVEGLESVEVAPEPPAPRPPVTVPVDSLFRRSRPAPSAPTMPAPALGEPDAVATSLEGPGS